MFLFKKKCALQFLKNGKLTNTVVYANESEHNPQQASLKTLAGSCQKTAFLWLRTYVLVLVLTYSPEYSLPQPRKLPVFWAAGGSTRVSTVRTSRVRKYAGRNLRFSGMPQSTS